MAVSISRQVFSFYHQFCIRLVATIVQSLLLYYYYWVGPDSSVGTAIRYGLDGPGIETRWGPPSLLYIGYRVFPWGKTAGAWRRPPSSPSDEVKERVELYLYSPSGPSWPILGWTIIIIIIIVLSSEAVSPWYYFSWTNGDPHCSGFKFQTVELSLLCVMFQV